MNRLLLVLCIFLSYNAIGQDFPTINKERLYETIDKDNEHKYFAIYIFTNGCSSGMYINQQQNALDSITNGQTRHIYAHSSKGNDRSER